MTKIKTIQMSEGTWNELKKIKQTRKGSYEDVIKDLLLTPGKGTKVGSKPNIIMDDETRYHLEGLIKKIESMSYEGNTTWKKYTIIKPFIMIQHAMRCWSNQHTKKHVVLKPSDIIDKIIDDKRYKDENKMFNDSILRFDVDEFKKIFTKNTIKDWIRVGYIDNDGLDDWSAEITELNDWELKGRFKTNEDLDERLEHLMKFKNDIEGGKSLDDTYGY